MIFLLAYLDLVGSNPSMTVFFCVLTFLSWNLTLLLLNMTCPVLANSVDPDQLVQLIWICTICH